MAITQIGVATLSDELLAYIKEQIKNGTVSFTDLIDAPDYAGQDGKFLKAFSGGGSSGMEWEDLPAAGLNWQVESTNFTASDKVGVLASNGITITLPATPVEGTLVAVADHLSEFDSNPVTVISNGANIGDDTELVLDLRNAYVQLIFDGTIWNISQVSHPFNIQEITEETFPPGQSVYNLGRVPANRSSLLVTVGSRVLNTSQYAVTGNVLTLGATAAEVVQVRHIGVPAAVRVSDTPVGAMLYFPNTEPVDGWLDCTGASISSQVYPDLVKFLAKDPNATLANLPDARGNFIRTYDFGSGVDVVTPYNIPTDLSSNTWGKWIDTLNSGTAKNAFDGTTSSRTTVRYTDGYIGYAFDAPVSMTGISIDCNDAFGTVHLPDTIQAKVSNDGITWMNASIVVPGGAALQGASTYLTITANEAYRYWAVFGTGGTPYTNGSGEYWGVVALTFIGSSTNRQVGDFQGESVGPLPSTTLGGTSAGPLAVQSGIGSVALGQGGTGTVSGGSETRPDNQSYVLRIKAFHYQSGNLAPTEVTSLRDEVSRLSTRVNDGTSYVQATAPENPSENARWYDTTSGRTYLWFNDGDSYQWVDDSPQSASHDTLGINAAPILAVQTTQARAINERFSDIINILDFGAFRNSTTDSKTAFDNAGVGPVFIPTGYYEVSSGDYSGSIYFSFGPVTITGAATGITVKDLLA